MLPARTHVMIRMSCSFHSFSLLFSQSLLTLDLIEDILAFKTEETEKKAKGKGSRKVHSDYIVNELFHYRIDMCLCLVYYL